ncbi:DUF1176 domain-containing protein [Pokkaliibacter sp. CJK22405]|uniref:DUF1176 domain-containing protein n=1 Tax=Pokkaliibacter sp. CJK22405 TaxID=3384615 RepID=UPI00398565C5
MKRFLLPLLASYLLPLLSWAAPAILPENLRPGVHFEHGDWEVSCDNTRTCRMAGYQDESSQSASLSVLLERTAGPSTPVLGQFQLGTYDDDGASPPITAVEMRIDGKFLGNIKLEDTLGKLNDSQVAALMNALEYEHPITFSSNQKRWELSSTGSNAVFLKADEVQGRLNTPSALYQTGKLPETQALPPLPVPVIHAATVKDQEARSFPDKKASSWIKRLRDKATKANECPSLSESDGIGEPTVQTAELSNGYSLIMTQCWLGAYQGGSGVWLHYPDDTPWPLHLPYSEGFADVSDYYQGQLLSNFKGRGLGDCWSSQDWTWTGHNFELTGQSSTGMCRLVAAGGAWHLPTFVSRVEIP